MTTIINEVQDEQKVIKSISSNWWAFIIKGFLALIFSVLAFIMPVFLALLRRFGKSGRESGGDGLFLALL